LDYKMTLEVMGIFTDLHKKGTTIVFATQYTGLIKRYPYRVIYVLNGRKVEVKKDKEVKAGE
jgi:ABC-type ATPase involved in cell division